MRLWVSRDDAAKIATWAMDHDQRQLADRAVRARFAANYREPWIVSRRATKPLLLRCEYCLEWEAFPKHRYSKAGWIKHGMWWVHRGECETLWEANHRELFAKRLAERERRQICEFLFSEPDMVSLYSGVLVRDLFWNEAPFAGLLDDMERQISAEHGNKYVREFIDGMPDELRSCLVGAGCQGYHYHYHVNLAWIDKVPVEYDEKEFPIGEQDRKEAGTLMTHSTVVTEIASKALRQQLPGSLRSRL